MGSFSLCVENTARDVQSLLVLHKVHPKVCIDVRRRMDQLIERSYEEMDVLEPGYGESSYDICHAIAKRIVQQTLEVGVPKSELAATERRIAERDQTIFEMKQRAEAAEAEIGHAHAVVEEVKKAHDFMLHSYFREVLVLRHQIEDLKKRQLVMAAAAPAPAGGAKAVGFPRFTRPPTGPATTNVASPVSVSHAEDSGVDDGRLTVMGNNFNVQADASLNNEYFATGMGNRMESPMEELSTMGKTVEPAMAFPRSGRNPVPPSLQRRGSNATYVALGRIGGGGLGRRNSEPHNAVFDYEVYVNLLKASQVDYEARYKALLAERGEMLKRHREARVKSMMDSKATLEESKFMIDELTKQLEASRAMSLMSEYKLRLCVEPIKENLNSLLNEIRMDVHHMQDEYAADMKRMTAAVVEAQNRSDALEDFVLTYVQAMAQLVVIVYEDASAKTEDALKDDPFTEIGYILPNFFAVGDNEKRVKPLVRLEEANRGRTVSASGGRPEDGKKRKRRPKVSVTDPSDPPKADEDAENVVISDPGQLYDAVAAKFWSDNPISRSAQRVLSEFQSLAMQLRARKEILLQQRELKSRSRGGTGESAKKGRLGDRNAEEDLNGTLFGRRVSAVMQRGEGRRGTKQLPPVSTADVMEIDTDFEFTHPTATLTTFAGGRHSIAGTDSPTSARQSGQSQSQSQTQGPQGAFHTPPQLATPTSAQPHPPHSARSGAGGSTRSLPCDEEKDEPPSRDGTSSASSAEYTPGRRQRRRREREKTELDSSGRGEAHLSVVDTSGLTVIYKKQVEMLQDHVQQLQIQLLEQHQNLMRYYNEKHERIGSLGGSFDETSPRGSKGGSISSTASVPPASPLLAYLPGPGSPEFQRLSPRSQRRSQHIQEKRTTPGFSNSLEMANSSSGSNSYQRMLRLALENQSKKSSIVESSPPPPPEKPKLHPYFLEEPPEGWRCPYCSGYFTMEQAMKALEDNPVPVKTSVSILKENWMLRKVRLAPQFRNCRELLRELRRLRYKRAVTQRRWHVASAHAGPIIFSPNTFVPPPSASHSPLAVAQQQCRHYETVQQRVSHRITELLYAFKQHLVDETEVVEMVNQVPRQLDIMKSIQGKRSAYSLSRSPYLVKPTERRRVVRVKTDDEEEEEEEQESQEIQAQPQTSTWIMELDGRRMPINSYWTEPLREEAKQRDDALAAAVAHQRALKKRGMFQSPYGAVSGYCTGVQQGVPAPEAHNGPVYLKFDYDKDRYFIINEYGHAALHQTATADAAADASGPPASKAKHPAEAPSLQPFPMTQIIVPAPLSMLPPPYNELAYMKGGATVSDGFVFFTDPEAAQQQQQQRPPPERPTSSPGPREVAAEGQRKLDRMQPVYLIPMTVPMHKSEVAYHGFGRTNEAEVYKLYQKKAHSGSDNGSEDGNDTRTASALPNGQRQRGGEEKEGEGGSYTALPPLPAALRSTSFGYLMSRDGAARIVSSYNPPTASAAALQNPPRVARPRNAEQNMFRIQAIGGGAAGEVEVEVDEALLSPRQRVASELAKAKRRQAAKAAEAQQQLDEERNRRQAEWDSRHDTEEPTRKEKFLRLRLPLVASSSKELPDANAVVKLQKKLATRDLVGQDRVKKPVLGGGLAEMARLHSGRSDDLEEEFNATTGRLKRRVGYEKVDFRGCLSHVLGSFLCMYLAATPGDRYEAQAFLHSLIIIIIFFLSLSLSQTQAKYISATQRKHQQAIDSSLATGERGYCHRLRARRDLSLQREIEVCRIYFWSGFFLLPWMWGFLYVYFAHFQDSTGGGAPTPAPRGAPQTQLDNRDRRTVSPPAGAANPAAADANADADADAAAVEEEANSAALRLMEAQQEADAELVRCMQIRWYLRWSRVLFFVSVVLFTTLNVAFWLFLPGTSWLWSDDVKSHQGRKKDKIEVPALSLPLPLSLSPSADELLCWPYKQGYCYWLLPRFFLSFFFLLLLHLAPQSSMLQLDEGVTRIALVVSGVSEIENQRWINRSDHQHTHTEEKGNSSNNNNNSTSHLFVNLSASFSNAELQSLSHPLSFALSFLLHLFHPHALMIYPPLILKPLQKCHTLGLIQLTTNIIIVIIIIIIILPLHVSTHIVARFHSVATLHREIILIKVNVVSKKNRCVTTPRVRRVPPPFFFLFIFIHIILFAITLTTLSLLLFTILNFDKNIIQIIYIYIYRKKKR
eukprot:gene11891-8176_t